jgi:hypothetical protein
MPMEVDFAESYLESQANPPVPDGFPQFAPVVIAGRTFYIDTSFEPYRRDAFRHRSIQAQRESIDLTNIPGEGTVNTEGLWRRSADDWSYGAGQPYQDRKGSADARFSTSKGINPWMQWQLELLDDTRLIYPLSAEARVAQVGKWLYTLDLGANTLQFGTNLTSSTWTTVTALPNNGNQALATNGYDIWIANNGTSPGIYHCNPGDAAVTKYVNEGVDGVWWVDDRLMASSGPSVYNIIAGGALPTALWTSPVADFHWTTMAFGSSQIYLGGYSLGGGDAPDFSLVYRSTIESTGTALTVPVQALPLEGGEYLTGLYGYLNFVFVGTNLGMRMCRTIAAYDPTGNEGDLEAGPLIPGLFPPGPVTLPIVSMVGNNRFVYFGWGNYDSESTGIGRADISTFIDTQSPAFTSDLMVTGSGQISSMDWCTMNQAPIFAVSGKGVYTSSNTVLESGNVQSGYLSYGIPDDKIMMAGDIGTITPQQGTVTMSLASDVGDNIFGYVGQQNSSSSGGTPNQSVFPINQIRGELFTVQLTLSRDPVTAQSPIVHRWTTKALPAVTAGTTISVVIRLWTVEDADGQDVFFDPYEVKAFLENLRTTQTVFEYQEGPLSQLCTVDEIDWLPQKNRDSDPNGGFEGNVIVYLKSWDLGA